MACCGIFEKKEKKKVWRFGIMRLQAVTITDDEGSLAQSCDS